MRLMVGPVLTSVFLVLCAVVFATDRPVSTGVRLRIPTLKAANDRNCPDDRDIVVVLKSGQLRINETPIAKGELKPTLRRIYEPRSEAAAFLMTDPDVPYSDFVSTLREMQESDSRLVIGLLTSGFRREIESWPAGTMYRLEFPEHPKTALCVSSPVQLVPIPRN